jgi:hypothetical protein
MKTHNTVYLETKLKISEGKEESTGIGALGRYYSFV